MKKFFCLLFLLTLTFNAFSDNNIPLVKDEPPSERSKEREQEAVISDNISENNDNDYWIGFKTITYDNPNQ